MFLRYLYEKNTQLIKQLFHKIFIVVVFLIAINLLQSKKLFACSSNPCFCIQINELGELTIIWDNSDFPIYDFYEHQFFADTGSGFVQIGAENDSTLNSFVFSNFNSNNFPVNFFMKSIYGPNNSLIYYTDTISSIYFNLVDQSNGNILLSWNHPIALDSIPLSSNYVIEKADFVNPLSSSNWTTVAVLPRDSISFLDNIGICSANINYRVKLQINNCNFTSNLDGGLIEDLEAPDAPVIQNVTTDTITGNIVVNWEASLAQDVFAYIVFKFYGGSWNSIDTLYGFQNTSFIDTNQSSFVNSIVQYSIAAMDSCSSGIPPQNNTSSAGLEHQNIVLNYQYDICLGQVSLYWNPYINFQYDLIEYQVYYKNDLTSWTLIDAIIDTNFNFVIPEGDLNYSFMINAVFDSTVLTSFSNTLSFYVDQPPIPQYSYISSVSVYQDTVRVVYLGENNIGINSINIYRSSDLGLTFTNIHSENSPVFPYEFNDLAASPNKKSYLYKVAVVDSCYNEVAFSNLGSSILLERKENNFLSNEIKWSSYLDWDYGVDNYEIMLNNNINVNDQFLVSLSNNNFSYSHDFNHLVNYPFDGKLCYKIIANEASNDLGINGQSISNELCIEHSPIVYVPNAINLKGINNKWKPLINLIDYSEYKVSIFNRVGQLIYELNNINEFWDGTILNSGRIAPLGIYVFLIELKNSRGQFITEKGSITLIR